MLLVRNSPFVYIVLVNYKGWADTIECLESVFRSDYFSYAVIICDNGSPNDSLGPIREWAQGTYVPEYKYTPAELRHMVMPGVAKPLPIQDFSREEAEAPGAKVRAGSLVLIQTGQNLGFAGGNNVGIRFAQARGGFDYIWLLNNDTVIAQDALRQLVGYAEVQKKKDSKIGIIGATLRYYKRPEFLQAIGGRYNKWFGTTSHIGAEEKDLGQYAAFNLEDLDYVVGASMMVSKSFLDEVGLMCEQYFLYFEELDWAIRARRLGWKLGYCVSCIVYHKEGGSTGSGSKETKSEFSDMFALKNRLVLSKKFFPAYLPTVYFGFGVVLLNRMKRGQFGRVKRILKTLLNT